ncbi:uncharacterized protein TNCV_253801 [Trichonephila clavipes]|nr:uncharacterized protein TNCV_253801 [Trichonephila clavipes]
MTSCNHMCCQSCNGFQEPFFNNVPPHTAMVSPKLSPHCYYFSLPAQSQDLSPIAHIWGHLGLRVGHPTSWKELEARLQQIWNEMSRHHTEFVCLNA